MRRTKFPKSMKSTLMTEQLTVQEELFDFIVVHNNEHTKPVKWSKCTRAKIEEEKARCKKERIPFEIIATIRLKNK